MFQPGTKEFLFGGFLASTLAPQSIGRPLGVLLDSSVPFYYSLILLLFFFFIYLSCSRSFGTHAKGGSIGLFSVHLGCTYKDILTPWVLVILLYIFARAYYILREASFSSLGIVLFLQASSLRPFLQASSLRPFSEASTSRPFSIASTLETLFGVVCF